MDYSALMDSLPYLLTTPFSANCLETMFGGMTLFALNPTSFVPPPPHGPPSDDLNHR
jgi:hypothetical protein